MKSGTTILLTLMGVLAGIIIFQYLFYSCDKRKLNDVIEDRDAQIEACLHAPAVVDTNIHRDTLIVPIQVPIHDYRVTGKKPIKDTVPGSDFAFSMDSVEQRQYSGVYEHPQFQLHWTADVTGTLDGLTFNPPSLIKSLIITKTKTVDLTQYQKPQQAVKEKSHLYTNMGVGFNGKALNSVDVGLMYIRKEGWGLNAGIGTDFNNLLFRGGLIIRLK